MSPKAQLKPNPFTAYRDPVTGRWVVIQPASTASPSLVDRSIVSALVEVREPCCV